MSTSERDDSHSVSHLGEVKWRLTYLSLPKHYIMQVELSPVPRRLKPLTLACLSRLTRFMSWLVAAEYLL
ncbi:MAG: hypothetical protein WED04_01560 [Promethearchaeati archaeon SRVP18_Atabeyarchaeia-1]